MPNKRSLGEMLVSANRGRTVQIDADKVSRGNFFTTDTAWLNQPVREFLSFAFLNQTSAGQAASVLDPFAGDGHLLDLIAGEYGIRVHGLDISNDLWPKNDSLKQVPNPEQSVIVTNPPYLANHSAKRKGVNSLVASYFKQGYDNLWKLALDRCLASADYVVAILPETFLLSTFAKDRLAVISVIEGELFDDTDAPALVACFGPAGVEGAGNVFINERLIGTLSKIMSCRGKGGRRGKPAVFNVADGRIGLRAVDGADGKTPIAFMLAEDFDYPANRIKVSSRLMTYIELPTLADQDLPGFVVRANRLLNEIREQSHDLVLAPFKGNMKTGRRRRRLDYELAREIISRSLS